MNRGIIVSKLQAALEWAKRGFRVFPLEENGREPAIAAFQVYASSDTKQIEAWWRDPLGNEREHNIGVLTTDLVVVDVDVKGGKQGLDTYYKMGGKFDTLTVQTPTGGYHCYYHGPDSALSAGKLGDGLDIRSHHGYVVAPGSTTPLGEYRLASDLPLRWVPPDIEAKLQPPGERVARDFDYAATNAPESIRLAVDWLKTSAPIAVEGLGGDTTTFAVAARLVRDYALSEEVAHDLLLRHWNDRCSPPWSPECLLHKVDNAYAYGSGELGSLTPEVIFSGVTWDAAHTPVLEIPPPEESTAPLGLHFGNFTPLMELTPRPWLMSPLLMRKAVTVLAAAGSAGKTSLALTLAAHGALGRDFGRFKIKTPFRTVFYSAEEDRAELTKRLWALCEAHEFDYKAVANNILVVDEEDFEGDKGGLSLARSQGRIPEANALHLDWLTDLLSDPGVGLCVLDPLAEIHGCDENDNMQMKYVLALARRIARKSDTALLINHHTSKGGTLSSGRVGNVEASRGAGSITNSARIALTLFGPTDKDKELYGISEDDAGRYVRLDDAKMNLTLASKDSTWFRKEGVALATGDNVGAFLHHEMRQDEETEKLRMAIILAEALTLDGSGAMSILAAVHRLQAMDPGVYERLSVNHLKVRIERILTPGVDTESGRVTCVRNHVGGKDVTTVRLG